MYCRTSGEQHLGCQTHPISRSYKDLLAYAAAAAEFAANHPAPAANKKVRLSTSASQPRAFSVKSLPELKAARAASAVTKAAEAAASAAEPGLPTAEKNRRAAAAATAQSEAAAAQQAAADAQRVAEEEAVKAAVKAAVQATESRLQLRIMLPPALMQLPYPFVKAIAHEAKQRGRKSADVFADVRAAVRFATVDNVLDVDKFCSMLRLLHDWYSWREQLTLVCAAASQLAPSSSKAEGVKERARVIEQQLQGWRNTLRSLQLQLAAADSSKPDRAQAPPPALKEIAEGITKVASSLAAVQRCPGGA
jgi:hypothetical protein